MQWTLVIPIVVALIGGPTMWFLDRLGKRIDRLDQNNTAQHGVSVQVLERVEQKIDGLDKRMDEHIHWHLNRHHHDNR